MTSTSENTKLVELAHAIGWDCQGEEARVTVVTLTEHINFLVAQTKSELLARVSDARLERDEARRERDEARRQLTRAETDETRLRNAVASVRELETALEHAERERDEARAELAIRGRG